LRSTHINLETVRYYEQEGLLAPPSRSATGYRKSAESAVDRLEFVKRAKLLGFSLAEIRDLLVIQDEQADTCVEVRDLLRTKLAIVRGKMTELQKLEGQLSSALRKCKSSVKAAANTARTKGMPSASPDV
jgi:DNA-binding transcriptional MerR regulator